MLFVHGQGNTEKSVTEDVVPPPGEGLVVWVHRVGASFRAGMTAGGVIAALVGQAGTVVEIKDLFAVFTHG